jgi:2-polyprenyl-3-methyl-5-hydroxy-6-metoxy-1,4-benzoquinol methylase
VYVVNLKKISKKILRLSQTYRKVEDLNRKVDQILEILDPDNFYNSGERQVTSNLSEIRPDHLGRYEFASQYINRNDKVLDIACGIGYGSFIMAKSNVGVSVTGVDISRQAVEYANKFYKKKNNRFVEGDCLTVEFEADYFDTIVSFETIEHIDQDEAFIKRVYGFLKSGGTFVCSTPNQDVMQYDPKRFPHHVKHYTVNEMKSILEESGFNVKTVFSQHRRKSKEVSPDTEGLYQIFVCQKI